MERTFVAFTIAVLAHASAHAAPPPQPIAAARPRTFVATEVSPGGYAFARQVLPSRSVAASVVASGIAQTRVIFLNRDGVVLWPGDNDARQATSSVVEEPTLITPWDIDDDTWDDTVACVRALYARFDVTITDQDPGDAHHLEAVFGGHPNDVGLPDEVAGVSPFTTDCAVIEDSVVFTFTDVLPDDARLMCEVMAQEIAHSYGLDHEMLASDPMTYLDYAGDRTFKDEMAPCGEYGTRGCGIGGSVCRARQNSVALLESRLGRRGSGAPDDTTGTTTTATSEPGAAGCAASGSGGGSSWLLVVGLVLRLSRRPGRRR